MKMNEKTDTLLPLAPPISQGDEAMPGEFAGMYQAGFEFGYSSGREAGFRQGYQAGYGDGRGQGTSSLPAAAEKRATGMPKTRLFALPCSQCRRFFLATRCGVHTARPQSQVSRKQVPRGVEISTGNDKE